MLIYHPNATDDFIEVSQSSGRTMKVRSMHAACFELDLRDAHGPFHLTWLRARDGATGDGGIVIGDAEVKLTAPWKGEDVVAYLAPTRRADEAHDKTLMSNPP